jgi:hypothetical protein
VEGDDTPHIFSVKINCTESVGTLKKAIKEEKKHAFQHVDADTLNIWKVGTLVDTHVPMLITPFVGQH